MSGQQLHLRAEMEKNSRNWQDSILRRQMRVCLSQFETDNMHAVQTTWNPQHFVLVFQTQFPCDSCCNLIFKFQVLFFLFSRLLIKFKCRWRFLLSLNVNRSRVFGRSRNLEQSRDYRTEIFKLGSRYQKIWSPPLTFIRNQNSLINEQIWIPY